MIPSSLPTVGKLCAIRTLFDDDPDGIQRGAFVLPPLSPGTFHLRLEIDDPGAAQKAVLETDIEVLPQPGRR